MLGAYWGVEFILGLLMIEDDPFHGGANFRLRNILLRTDRINGLFVDEALSARCVVGTGVEELVQARQLTLDMVVPDEGGVGKRAAHCATHMSQCCVQIQAQHSCGVCVWVMRLEDRAQNGEDGLCKLQCGPFALPMSC